MTYTVRLQDGKYEIDNNNGSLRFRRNGEHWFAADDLKHSGVVLALVQRIEELETAKARAELLRLAQDCGAVLTGKPNGSQPITVVFSVESWRKFDRKLAPCTIIDVSKEYEELRTILVGGGENSTHADAIARLGKLDADADRLQLIAEASQNISKQFTNLQSLISGEDPNAPA